MITKIPSIVRASDLRNNLARYIRESAKTPVVISVDRGGGNRVLIGSDLYNTLVCAYEDAEDKKLLEERVKKDTGARTSLDSLRRQYEV